MNRLWPDAPPKCPACNTDLGFWQAASRRCRHCDAPLQLDDAHLLVTLPMAAFFGAAILTEIPLYVLAGGAWLLLSVPVGLLACIFAWWATWRCCIAVARDEDRGDG